LQIQDDSVITVWLKKENQGTIEKQRKKDRLKRNERTKNKLISEQGH